jgi:FixJ family two-component response regulator
MTSIPDVLVVDDEEIVRTELSDILSLRQFRCFAANGIAAARSELAGNPQIRIVVTDYHMPQMDGIELIESLSNEVDRKLAFIMLTGDASQDAAVEALRVNATDFLKKPVDARELIAAVYRAWQRLADESKTAQEQQVKHAREAREQTLQELRRIEGTLQKLRAAHAVRRSPSVSAIGTLLSYCERLCQTLEASHDAEQAAALGEKLVNILGLLFVPDEDVGLIHLDLRPTDFSNMVARLAPSVDQFARTRGLQFQSRVSKGLPFICSDEMRLARAMIEMALALLSQLEPDHRLVLTALPEKGDLVVTMKAEGSTVPATFLAPFNESPFEIDNEDLSEQTVKLAAARLIILLHGGRVLVSQEGGEMRVRLFLPLATAPVKLYATTS